MISHLLILAFELFLRVPKVVPRPDILLQLHHLFELIICLDADVVKCFLDFPSLSECFWHCIACKHLIVDVVAHSEVRVAFLLLGCDGEKMVLFEFGGAVEVCWKLVEFFEEAKKFICLFLGLVVLLTQLLDPQKRLSQKLFRADKYLLKLWYLYDMT